MCVFSDDVIVAISNSGTVKVWTLSGKVSKVSIPLTKPDSRDHMIKMYGVTE